jgi:hypothetical protein
MITRSIKKYLCTLVYRLVRLPAYLRAYRLTVFPAYLRAQEPIEIGENLFEARTY